MRIKIGDECERGMIFCAIWKHAQDANVEKLEDRIYEHAWTRIDPILGAPPEDVDVSAELMSTIRMLETAQAASARVENASLGDVVEIPVEREEFVRHMRDCSTTIAENAEFWEVPREWQERWLASREAAESLAAQHSEITPAEAVA